VGITGAGAAVNRTACTALVVAMRARKQAALADYGEMLMQAFRRRLLNVRFVIALGALTVAGCVSRAYVYDDAPGNYYGGGSGYYSTVQPGYYGYTGYYGYQGYYPPVRYPPTVVYRDRGDDRAEHQHGGRDDGKYDDRHDSGHDRRDSRNDHGRNDSGHDRQDSRNDHGRNDSGHDRRDSGNDHGRNDGRNDQGRHDGGPASSPPDRHSSRDNTEPRAPVRRTPDSRSVDRAVEP
jgi:hypothetical protein